MEKWVEIKEAIPQNQSFQPKIGQTLRVFQINLVNLNKYVEGFTQIESNKNYSNFSLPVGFKFLSVLYMKKRLLLRKPWKIDVANKFLQIFGQIFSHEHLKMRSIFTNILKESKNRSMIVVPLILQAKKAQGRQFQWSREVIRWWKIYNPVKLELRRQTFD